MYSPLTWHTRVAPKGPSMGMSDSDKAAEAPRIASTSVGFSLSTESTVMTTWISSLIPLGKRGRRGLSVSLAVSVASWVGLPSRREKAARDSSGSIKTLLIVYGEGEEVYVPGERVGAGRDQ